MKIIIKNNQTRALNSIIVSLFLIGSVGAQTKSTGPTSTTPATKMEAFKPAAGSVLTIGYDTLGTRIGSRGNIEVDVRELRDAKGAVVRGVVVEISESQYRQERSFIDADELPELLKGLDALLAVKENPTQFKNFEVRYMTRGELELTVFNGTGGKLSYAVKAGRPVGAQTFITANDMEQLRSLFDGAAQKLAALAPIK